jgi:hypothetical protein
VKGTSKRNATATDQIPRQMHSHNGNDHASDEHAARPADRTEAANELLRDLRDQARERRGHRVFKAAHGATQALGLSRKHEENDSTDVETAARSRRPT